MLRVTTLVENTQGEHLALRNEHGISFYIEKEGYRILFDTGQSDAYLDNAFRMGVDPSLLDAVVISHGHYDHSGGFRHLLRYTDTFQLRLGQGFFTEKYAFRNGAYDFLGNDFDESLLKERKIAYSFVTGEVEQLMPGVYIITGFPRIHEDERVNPRFVLRTEEGFVEDPFDDELLLALESSKGWVVVLGCSHPGMRNMLDAVRNHLGGSIYAVLGGTHLVEAEGASLERSLHYLQDPEFGVIGVSHCTGKEAVSRLKEMLEEQGRFFHNVTGSSLFLD
ncbi:MAG: MBL fold metallo-hydrolase [Synergistales bacterium]|nr:MBL fold metallo-hydrolase [Synergistales bacterium]